MNITVSKSYLKFFCLSCLTLIISCKKDMKTQSENILLQEWQGPYGGVPAFDKMVLAIFKKPLKRHGTQPCGDRSYCKFNRTSHF